MPLDFPRRGDGAVGRRLGEAQAIDEAVQTADFLEAVRQAEHIGQLARQPFAGREALDEGRATREGPRGTGIVAAIHEDPAFHQRLPRGAEARCEEGHPDQRGDRHGACTR